MNGYVASLVSRALGEAPVLRPRTPSLFEGYAGPPATVEAAPDAGPAPRPARTPSGPASAVREPHARSVEDPPPVSASAPEEQPITPPGTPPTRLEATVRPVQPLSERPAAPRTSLPESPLRVAQPSAQHLTHHEERIVVSRAVPEAASPVRPASEPGTAAAPVAPATNRMRMTPPPTPASSPHERHEERREEHHDVVDATVRAGRSITPAPAVMAPQTPRLSPSLIAPPRAMTPAPPAAALSAAPPAEPTIRVTIGRVDVRAVVQPAQARRTAEVSRPKLTLEDYLGGGGGG